MDAREVALLTLNACERQGGWSDGVLKKQLAQSELDSRDAGLATQLCFGVLQNKLLLDFYLSKFSNIPLKRMESKVVQAMRIGLYQMLFLTRIPHSAAVNSAARPSLGDKCIKIPPIKKGADLSAPLDCLRNRNYFFLPPNRLEMEPMMPRVI